MISPRSRRAATLTAAASPLLSLTVAVAPAYGAPATVAPAAQPSSTDLLSPAAIRLGTPALALLTMDGSVYRIVPVI